MIWIINLNSNLCRIYTYQLHPPSLTLIKEIGEPALRMKAAEVLTTDKPGRYKTRDATGSAYSPRTDAKTVAINHFLHEVANEINHGRTNQKFDRIIIIAPAQISGLLFQNTDKQVKEKMIENIQKDLIHLKNHELLTYIKENAHITQLNPNP